MALKALFNAMKHTDGYVIKDLDMFLVMNQEENDRALNVNAPSQAGGCLRGNYYARMQVKSDGLIDARTQRIFDNGSYVHVRLQTYLTKMGKLKMEEVPLRNDEYNIQGHTDGLLALSQQELGILEIKSINDGQYSELRDVKEEHKKQGTVYLFCAESRRKYLQKTYKDLKQFNLSLSKRIEYYKSLYKHLKDGKKYTREEKLKFKVEEHIKADTLLYNTKLPITKVIFIYENKNTQDIKEFVYMRDSNLEAEVLEDYSYLNECIENEKIPSRCSKSKSVPPCKWCNYKLECWN